MPSRLSLAALWLLALHAGLAALACTGPAMPPGAGSAASAPAAAPEPAPVRASARAAHTSVPPSALVPTRAPADPELTRLLSVRDGRTDAALSFDTLLDELSSADVVFLGESHTDETTHRVELAVLEGLLVRREGQVALALEMFERDNQAVLDDYLARRIDEATFLATARPWGNYATGYRPLVQTARAAGAPVIASNFPRPLRQRIAEGGVAALDALPPEQRAWAPQTLLPNTPLYWRRSDNAVRSHSAMMGPSAATPAATSTPEEDAASVQRLTSTQSLWDNSMGESCALALDNHPGHLVLHVNGGFHSQYWDGTVRQLRLRKPDARVVTVAIEPVANPGSSELSGAPEADYVVFAERWANEPQNGEGSVFVQRELKYKLHLPASVAPGKGGARVPLLIWLSDDGLTAEENLDLWKLRLGDEAAIAVLEAPYQETQEDLAPGGRWYGSEDFDSDIGLACAAVERTYAYLADHAPIDLSRVCLAGEGTGATVAVAAALYADELAARAVAIEPRRYSKLRDLSLPLPELRGQDPRPMTSLRVVVEAADDAADHGAAAAGASGGGAAGAGASPADWWRDELAEYARVEFPSVLVPGASDPWQAWSQVESEVRTALRLEMPAPTSSKARRFVLADAGSPRSRFWSRRFALEKTAADSDPVAVFMTPPTDTAAALVVTEIRAADFAGEGALPTCPGPFGGTTVVVLPAGAPADELAAWKALVENDPLTRKSRFTRLRVAASGGDAADELPAVLTKLESENRRNVLIVPAVFHADGETMRALSRSVQPFAERMTLHWRPGLGGR